ncbi:putative CONSERVED TRANSMEMBRANE PROTEIN [Pseudonocardia sp. Ae168_Ps1]|nr:putative CONSERVED TRANSMEMBRANE PROTEIN [Pseudonocardia sp. Ae168_Ps1]OLL83197.1 putative CONSERVED TRANSMEMBRANE PROTEIN [Pseudonocardia sp. Ae263_Ps1]
MITAYPWFVFSRRGAVVADVVAVVVFAAIGRMSHAEAGSVVGLAGTALPFLAGAAVAWATPWVRAEPVSFRAGLVVVALTAGVGCLLRWAFLGRLPLSFAIVTVVALAVLLLGWRGVSAAVVRVQAARETSRG